MQKMGTHHVPYALKSADIVDHSVECGIELDKIVDNRRKLGVYRASLITYMFQLGQKLLSWFNWISDKSIKNDVKYSNIAAYRPCPPVPFSGHRQGPTWDNQAPFSEERKMRMIRKVVKIKMEKPSCLCRQLEQRQQGNWFLWFPFPERRKGPSSRYDIFRSTTTAKSSVMAGRSPSRKKTHPAGKPKYYHLR